MKDKESAQRLLEKVKDAKWFVNPNAPAMEGVRVILEVFLEYIELKLNEDVKDVL